MVAATLDRNPSTAQSLLVPEASLDSTIDVGALNVTHLTTAAKSVSVVDVQIEDTQAAGSLRIAKFAVTALLTIGLQVVALAFIFRYIDELSQISALAYPGVMLAEFSNSAMVNLPTPWPAFTLGMAVFLNPFLVGLLGGLAAATGELVGYFLGVRGRSIVDGGRFYARVQKWTDRFGAKAIFVFAVLPVPFDLAGAWAGTVRFPLFKFFHSVAAAKIIRITLLAAASHYGFSLLTS
ncbi:MAG: VTT domain-containing protein [SAR202 cluster bacterium]|nr:VTT domain-containing protein [SAR202 cluster bacterium]